VNKCGYIICNFLENIEQAQNLFDLEQFEYNKENDLQFFEDEIHPSIIYKILQRKKIKSFINAAIIIDVIMVGNNVMRKMKYNSEAEQSNLNSKLVCDDAFDKLLDWPSLDSKYTESEIMNHILENE